LFPQFAEKTKTALGDVYSQQDSDEFLNNLLMTVGSRVEDQLPNSVANLFRGDFDVKYVF